MAKRKSTTSNKRPIEQYEHKDKDRVNNPPVGLVTPDTDIDFPKKKYSYDPHLDPQLQWAGKAERLSFDVDTVSLHVHERIDPRSIMEAVRKKNGSNYEQESLFQEEVPLKNAIEFYKHRHNWSNRLIAGDSLLVMNSLIEKEGLAGQVQMVYFDPPYGIKYGSNFQPFVNKRDVKDGKDEDLSGEPETIKAFRDTWELGIHSYLSYLRDRLLVAKELLTDTGSCFVQIGEENVQLARSIMDEIFGVNNYVSQISVFKTTTPRLLLDNNLFYVLWYSKNIEKIKYYQLFVDKPLQEWTSETKGGSWGVTINGKDRKLTPEEKKNSSLLSKGAEVYQLSGLTSAGESANPEPFKYNDKEFFPGVGNHWKTKVDGLYNLIKRNRIEARDEKPWFKKYHIDFPVKRLTNVWDDTSGKSNEKLYVVQTQDLVIERCILMTTNPGDLVLDITCGSGTTSFVAEQWGRRWITCDTSRVALTLAKQRLMTAVYDYYQLAHPNEGVGSGFKYKTVPHITLKSIANNEPPATETLYDQPFIDKSKARVTGPFTVEAVPSPTVKSIDDMTSPQPPPFQGGGAITADNSIVRSGETLRQSEWRDELLRSGIRGKNGQYILFSRVEPLPGTRWLHADAETKSNDIGADRVSDKKGKTNLPSAERVVISFGPEHSPLEQRQVALALEEAQTLVPKPKIVVFASFQFDPEAAKDIDEINWPGVTLLKVQMNPDMMTDDLKKKRASNESFWLIGSPDVKLTKVKGKDKEEQLYQIEVLGFDYFNTKTGNIESGSKDRIAMWMLDTDYDGMSLFPRQVFFPMAGEKEGWSKLAKNLKAEIDEELIEAYKGTISLPFPAGDYKRVAVKIVDDRGIESLKVLEIIK
ncbi:MAG: site-specific DNA-methyltransferase [Bacteroidota bacterium]|nr:site-specific DNA-methyltransferase [Bacteroidota bacterium]